MRGVGVHGPSCACGAVGAGVVVGAGRVGSRTVSHPVPLPACAQGQHGLDCQQRCECQHGGLCDRRTGHCLCQPGWTGDKCERRKRGTGGLVWASMALAAPGAAQGGSGGLSKDIKFRFQPSRELAVPWFWLCPSFAHCCAFSFH